MRIGDGCCYVFGNEEISLKVANPGFYIVSILTMDKLVEHTQLEKRGNRTESEYPPI